MQPDLERLLEDPQRIGDAVRALRQTTARFDAALRATPIVMFDQGPDLRYTWVHNGGASVFDGDLLGRTDVEVLQRPSDAQRLDGLKRAVLADGVARRAEVPILRGRTEHWFDVVFHPQRDERGEVAGIIGAAVEITDRRHRERHFRFLASLNELFTQTTSAGVLAVEVGRQVLQHFELSRCLLVEVDEVSGHAAVLHEHHAAGLRELSGGFRLDAFHTAEELQRLASGKPVAVDDVSEAERGADAIDRLRALEIGAVVDVPYLNDGRWRFVLCAIRPAAYSWRTDEVALLQDVAARTWLGLERARTEAALRMAHDTFHHLVEQSPFGVYVVNADFRLVLVSAGAQRVFENVRPLLGRDFADVLRTIWPEPFAAEAISRFRHTLRTGESFHAPSTVEQRQDIAAVETYDWKIERIVLPDGRFGVVCHFYDLSERQRVAAALQEADRRKDEFIAMLAHELRNPLAPIRTAVGILQASPVQDPLVVRCRDIINRQIGMMARLLDDLLDVSRLSHGRLMLRQERLQLDEVLATAIETSRPLLEARRQPFDADIEPALVVQGDATRLTQLFANLLNNAAKYTPEGGAVRVSARSEAGRAIIRVRDTGVGIAADMLDRVFDLFTRADERDPQSDGLGVGLTLAKQLAELHGGTVTVHSDGVGRGSEFIVSLPLLTDDAATPLLSTTTVDAAPLHVARVLVVDDNVDAADTTAMLLEGAGCEVRVAYSGEQAVRLADTWRPAVVFMDLGMPIMDGYEAAGQVRAVCGEGEVLLVAVSGWGQDHDRERSTRAGFDQHLTKPVDPEVMVRLVRDAATARAAGRRT